MKRRSTASIDLALALLLAVALMTSAAVGAFTFSPARMAGYLAQGAGWVPLRAEDALDRGVFLQLRLPRVLLAALTGAVLGVSGTLMQGLFRNPIVEPGLAGTSAGGPFGAGAAVRFWHRPVGVPPPPGPPPPPPLAFFRAPAAPRLVFLLSPPVRPAA